MTAVQTPEPEVEIIEVIEEIFDNKMALTMLALGAVVGGIVFYLWMESKRTGGVPRLGVVAPVVPDIEYVDDDSEDDD